jgi:hypothetical protein
VISGHAFQGAVDLRVDRRRILGDVVRHERGGPVRGAGDQDSL